MHPRRPSIRAATKTYEVILEEVSEKQGSCMEGLRRQIAADLRADTFPIPPLPLPLVELQQITQSSQPDLRAACRVIERDANLAGRVTALASSATYGQPVRDLGQAVVRLGASGLRDVAYALMLGRVFRGHGQFDDLMQRALAQGFPKARAAQATFHRRGLDNKLGFLAGLLADIGRLAVINTLANYPAARDLEVALLVSVIDKLHDEVGPLVLSRWKLAAELRAVAAHHHQPETAREARPEVSAAGFAVTLVEVLEAIEENGPLDDETLEWLAQEPMLPLAKELSLEDLRFITTIAQQAREAGN